MLYRRVNVLLWVARLASQNQIPRATFNSKTGRHDTSIQRTIGHEKEIPLYMSKTVSLRIHLKQVHRHVWHRDGQNVSIGYDHHQRWWQRNNGDAWKQSNVAQHVVECSATHAAVLWEVAEVSVVVDSYGWLATPVHPIDVQLGLNLANGQAKVTPGRFDEQKLQTNTCNVWSGWNIPPLTFICRMTCYCRISSRCLLPVSSPATCARAVLPPWWIPAVITKRSTPKRSICCCSLQHNIPLNVSINVCVRQHATGENETSEKETVSPSTDTTADSPLNDVRSKRRVTLVC